MLQELYDELNALLTTASDSGGSAFRPSPKGGGTQTVFVARDDLGAWYTLDGDNSKGYIPTDVSLFGKITNIEDAMSSPSSSKYKPSRKLKVYVEGTDGKTYMLYCGFDTAFGKSLIKGLNSLSAAQLQNVAIGVSLSDQDEKVVFANVTTQDGHWEKSDNTTDIEVQYGALRALLGLAPSSDAAPTPAKKATKPVAVKSVHEDDGIPF